MSTQLARRNKNTTAVVLLEVIPGLFGFFGIGHMAQGRIGMGLFIMLSYIVLQAINAALTFVLIGYITAPLTMLFYLIAAPTNAADYERNRV